MTNKYLEKVAGDLGQLAALLTLTGIHAGSQAAKKHAGKLAAGAGAAVGGTAGYLAGKHAGKKEVEKKAEHNVYIEKIALSLPRSLSRFAGKFDKGILEQSSRVLRQARGDHRTPRAYLAENAKSYAGTKTSENEFVKRVAAKQEAHHGAKVQEELNRTGTTGPAYDAYMASKAKTDADLIHTGKAARKANTRAQRTQRANELATKGARGALLRGAAGAGATVGSVGVGGYAVATKD